LNSGSLAPQSAQVVQPCPANLALSDNLYTFNPGGMKRKCPFNPYPVRDPANGKSFAQATASAPDYNAFKNLDSFPAALNNLNMHSYGIAGAKLNNILFGLFLFK